MSPGACNPLCYRLLVSGDDAPGTSLEVRTQAFLAEFFDRGQELVRDLIHENEGLRTQLDGIESGPDVPSAVVNRLRQRVADLEAECERMRRLAGTVEKDAGGYRERLEELEVAHYHLAARQVSAEQLRHAVSLEDVVRSTTEILLNLVGVGRFVIHGIDPARSLLFPLRLEGRDAEDEADPSERPLSEAGTVGVAASATTFWQASSDTRRELTASMAIPLVSGSVTVGVIELVRFLPQKKEFTDDDFALLELISSESGAALDAAWMRAHAQDVPFSRSGVEALLR